MPPDRTILPDAVNNPGLMCVAQRPYLPDVVPGHDLYIWIDADIWIQRADVIEIYLHSARDGSVAVTPELHVAYPGVYQGIGRIRQDVADYTSIFDTHSAERMAGNPTLNGGMLALRADSGFWSRWRTTFQAAYSRTHFFYSEQCALNHVVYVQDAAAQFLPAWCNWVCHKCLPRIDLKSGKLCEPVPAYNELGVVHMTLNTKDGEQSLLTTDGGMVRRSIRYRRDEY